MFDFPSISVCYWKLCLWRWQSNVCQVLVLDVKCTLVWLLVWLCGDFWDTDHHILLAVLNSVICMADLINCYLLTWMFFSFWNILKVALQILERKFYKNTKKSSLNSKGLLIFINKTPVAESHPTAIERLRDLLWPRSTPTGNTIYFYMSSSFIYILKTKLQTLHSMKILWKIITCLLCYGI